MKSREKSKIQTNKNLIIPINLTEQISNLDTDDKQFTEGRNQNSLTLKNFKPIKKSNFVLNKEKKINISKLNITEFENFSIPKSNFNKTQDNFRSNQNLVTTQTKFTSETRKDGKIKFQDPKTTNNLIKTKATPSTERIFMIQQQNKSKLVDRKITEKKTQIEIHNLMNEQSKLRKSLEKTKDQLALGLISKKILDINHRIKNLMNNIKFINKEENQIQLEQERESQNGFMKISKSLKSKNHMNALSDKNKNKFQISNCISYRNDWTSFNKKKIRHKSSTKVIRNLSNNRIESEQTSLTISSEEFEMGENDTLNIEKEKYQKMMDNNLKIEQIFLQSKLLEQKKKISQNHKSDFRNSVKYPNFIFLRPNQKGDNQNLYTPTTNISNGVNLFIKSYRPQGFRNRREDRNNKKSGNNINLKISESSHFNLDLNFTGQLTMPNHKRNIQDIIEENDKNNRLINNKQLIDALRNKKQKPRTAFITATEMNINPKDSTSAVYSRPHSASDFVNKIDPKFSLNSQMKNLRKIYAQVLNDHNIIEKGVVSHYKLKKRKFRASDYDNLLKLWEMNLLGDDKKNLRNRRDHDEKKKDYLKTFCGADRKFLQEVYRQMNYENRILNKFNGYQTNPDEIKIAQLRMHREFKKIARETMFMKKEQIDDQDLDIKKQFEHHYANLDQLQWIVQKRKVLKNIKSRFLIRLKE